MSLWDHRPNDQEALDDFAEKLKKHKITLPEDPPIEFEAGKRLFNNIAEEEQIHPELISLLFDSLLTVLQKTHSDDPTNMLCDAIEGMGHPDDVFLRTPVDPHDLPTSLSHMTPLETFYRYNLSNDPEMLPPNDKVEQTWELIRKGQLNFPLRGTFGKTERAWSTFTEAIQGISSADDLRDQLGLSHFYKGEKVVELLYKPEAIQKPAIPTILEAGGKNWAFKPSQKGDKYGWTQDLKTGKKVHPEIVHKGVRATDLFGKPQARGIVSRNWWR